MWDAVLSKGFGEFGDDSAQPVQMSTSVPFGQAPLVADEGSYDSSALRRFGEHRDDCLEFRIAVTVQAPTCSDDGAQVLHDFSRDAFFGKERRHPWRICGDGLTRNAPDRE